MGAKSSKAPPASDAATGATSKADKSSATLLFLILTEENTGTLTLHYAASPPSTPLVTATPSKTIPAHKLTTNGGRIEMGRNFGTSTKKMLEAVAAFVREVAAVDGTLKLNSTEKFELWSLQGTTVKAIPKGSSVATKGLDCIAVLPANNTSLKGVKTIDQTQFVGICTREGAYWKR